MMTNKTRKLVISLFTTITLLTSNAIFAANDLEQFTSDMSDETRWNNAPGWAPTTGWVNGAGDATVARSPLYSLCDTCNPWYHPSPETLQCLSCGGCSGCSGGCGSCGSGY